jgi:hypothetical protein
MQSIPYGKKYSAADEALFWFVEARSSLAFGGNYNPEEINRRIAEIREYIALHIERDPSHQRLAGVTTGHPSRGALFCVMAQAQR